MDEFITQLLSCEEMLQNMPSKEMKTTAVLAVDSESTDNIESLTVLPTDPDIAILAEKYGELHQGMSITLDIASACDLLHKTRRRSDTFIKLQKKLVEQYGVELIILSRKHSDA